MRLLARSLRAEPACVGEWSDLTRAPPPHLPSGPRRAGLPSSETLDACCTKKCKEDLKRFPGWSRLVAGLDEMWRTLPLRHLGSPGFWRGVTRTESAPAESKKASL